MAVRVERGHVASGRGGGRVLLAAAALVLAGLGGVAKPAFAQAADCPNEQLRGQQGYALRLPDCRAYEQVSPVEKNFTDALGESGVVQGSPSGDGITFFSHAPFPGVLSATGSSLYLSTRAGDEWSTQGLVPPTAPRSLPQQGAASVLSLTEALSATIVNTEPGLETGLAPGRYSYLRDSVTGSFRLLAPGVTRLADAATDDSRIIFESGRQLLSNAAPGVVNLYEWDGSKPPGQELSLAGVLPPVAGGNPAGEAPVEGSVAGPGGPALGGSVGGATGEFYTQNTISADGSRVFFSDAGTGQIYMREPVAAKTIPVSAGTEPAYWRAATADGSKVFYTEGEDLYRFNLNRYEESKQPESTALAEAREQLTSGVAGVLGMLGISTEGSSYAYFVATGVLAGNENGNQEKAEVGEGNLYQWHGGKTVFIARLSTENEYDEYDWRDFYVPDSGAAPATGEKSSRVVPDGRAALFASRAQLTSYENANQDELYLYDATSGRLTCVSCNPSGARATSSVYLTGNLLPAGGESRNAFLTRNLSDDGSRVFFQTQEALVPQDTNEQVDVYEWEREGAGGVDGCTRSSTSFSASSGGCLYLISTGQSSDQSYFGDASADGNNVFFFTRQSLVGQDQDENDDLYDARVEGGIAAQNPSPTTSCSGEEGCLGPTVSAPGFDAPSSTTFVGFGNLAPQPAAKPKAKSKPKPLTRAQKLAQALKACRRQPRRKRGSCEARARKQYGRQAKYDGGQAKSGERAIKPRSARSVER